MELPNGIMTIKFRKVDGTERTLKCTVDPKIIGQEIYEAFSNKTNADGTKRKKPKNTTTVFDLDSQSWKSFVDDNLISIEF